MKLEEQIETAKKYVGRSWKDTRLFNSVVEVESMDIEKGEVILIIKGKPLKCSLEYAIGNFESA